MSGELNRLKAGLSGMHWSMCMPRAGVWVSLMWGRPTDEDVRGLVGAYDRALAVRDSPTFVSVNDCQRLEAVDPDVFGVLLEFMVARQAAFERQMQKQAIVRPAGMIGTLATGFYELLGYKTPVEIFVDRRPALRWLVGDEEALALDAEIERRTRDADTTPAVVREVRALLMARPELEVDAVALELRRSSRSLQRQLTEVGSSFREVRAEVRIALASALLIDSDRKIASIASRVGYTSMQQFARMFRQQTGDSPTAFRQKHRR